MARLVAAATGAFLLGAQADESEQLAAPKFLSVSAPQALPGLPAAPLVQCQIGTPAMWPETQRIWCCQHEQIGCATTAAPASSATTKVKLWSWGGGDANAKDAEAMAEASSKSATQPSTSTTPVPTTTSLPPTTTTEMPTTTTHTCEELCIVAGVTASCKDHIQQASLSDFLGLPDSCSLAQANIAANCPICGGCSPRAVGCGMLEAPTTTGPTTSIPKGDPCNAVCTFGEQPATCNARIRWSVEHVFAGKPHACSQAHDMVQDQCGVCSWCELGESDCGAAAPTDEDRLFDCEKGASVEWSQAKAVWCCEHHSKACDRTDTKHVFFQKKVAESGMTSKARSSLSVVVIAGLAALGASVAFFLRGTRGQYHSSRMHSGLVANQILPE